MADQNKKQSQNPVKIRMPLRPIAIHDVVKTNYHRNGRGKIVTTKCVVDGRTFTANPPPRFRH